MAPLGYNRVPSPVDCHNYEEDVEPRVDPAMVTQSMMLIGENFVDIPIENDDVDELVDEDDPLENKSFLNASDYEVPSPLFKELNWDVINAMSVETLTSRSGLWNESNELYEGLRFENKADLQYAVKRYSIHRNQHLVVSESEPSLWPVKCKESNDGCRWRLRACRHKTHGMFEITKYICHAPTPAWAKRGGAKRDWDSLTYFSDIDGPISYIIS